MRTVVLSGICIRSRKKEFETMAEECRDLCRACSMDIAAEVFQNLESMDPRYAMRSGKLEELADTVAMTQADAVVFCNDLSVAAGGRIEELTGVQVIDRTALILEIFSLRARSRQAKLQVEAARLQYALPRTALKDEVETHERGGAYRSRGAGEMRSAGIRRKYQARIQALKKELKDIEVENRTAQNRRAKSSLKRVALAGYTNAGKSSLLNAILKQSGRSDGQVLEKDMLFATLDTSVRQITWRKQQFLLYDTVGFVSHLPHMLVEAFKSTLDSAREADLLIQVIDASDTEMEQKIQVTRDTLEEIGAGSIPVLRVYTKADLCPPGQLPEGLCVSSITGEGIPQLLERICAWLYPPEVEFTCFVPYNEMALIQDARRTLRVTVLSEEAEGMYVQVAGEKTRQNVFRKFERKREQEA